MGTNYFWHDRPCGSCGRFTEVHVCLSRHTWRAYPNTFLNAAHPDWGLSVESPFGTPVMSLADWRHVFTTRPGALFDEYGSQVADPVAWLDEAKPWQPNPDGDHYLAHDIRDGRGWLDVDGFRFYNGEFS